MSSFQAAAQDVGIELDSEQLRLLRLTANWLASLAQASGVSAYNTAQEVLDRAMAPALAYFAIPETPRQGAMADVGAGNGALGATMAILEPRLAVDLVDRARRAYTACELLEARLRLPNLTAVHLDVRDVTAPTYVAAVLRAVARGPAALALAQPMLVPGGVLAAYHRSDDAWFCDSFGLFQLVRTVPTTVEGLVLSAYRLTGPRVLSSVDHSVDDSGPRPVP
ncbi:MAG: RsmG family class I SAM-dependent methyltransferase [Armatimonadota bacterium]